jgi:hypothetical protein
MRIGIDFDNTIVCYDDVFHKAALEKGLIPAHVPQNKGAVRDYLRTIGREDDWTALQGYIYGARMDLAQPFPGVFEFMRRVLGAGIDVCIISHKTRTPYLGPSYDLHAAAYAWLESHDLFRSTGVGLDRSRVFFELTKQDKLRRIASERRAVFIDDLPELLSEPEFPANVRRVLFDPGQKEADVAGLERVPSWDAISTLLLDSTESQLASK